MNTTLTTLTNSVSPSNVAHYVVKLAYNLVFAPSKLPADIDNIIDSEECYNGECDYSNGSTAITIAQNHYLSEIGDPIEHIFEMKEWIDSHAEAINDADIEVTTNVVFPNLERASFSCIHNKSNLKGLPQSIYDAMAYVIENIEITQVEILELFSAATHSLAIDCFYSVDDFDFNVKSALEHDLNEKLIQYNNTQGGNIMSFGTQVLLNTYTNKAKQHACKGPKVRMAEYVESAMEVQAQVGRIDNLDAITREFEQRLASKSNWGYKLAAEQLSEAIKTVEKH
ncbi:hypothetical protein R7P67_22395 [Vibrio sp. Vb0937]|uniref:hypothetical protein n=1 Tax=unclassified Vibrio TaxID=2614977 RepID=UPI0029645F28|nr:MULTISPECIES: hypothetical protein [unclassified Vibrio]MDW1827788.1 hypothetical protein [Vibrio sp. Vb0937]MDW3189000.1 hypothetical protein [Vibrio sp. Vb0932]